MRAWKALESLYLTVKFSIFDVSGYYTVPSTSYISRVGCVPSDMFRIKIYDTECKGRGGDITLAEFHEAFLLCPLFQLELLLLRSLSHTIAQSQTTSIEHLKRVAHGKQNSFGPWTYYSSEGNRTESIKSILLSKLKANKANDDNQATSATTTTVSACQIMQCEPNGPKSRPFCHTWWAVEATSRNTSGNVSTDSIVTELVFGTHLIDHRNNEDNRNNTTIFDRVEPFFIKVLDPIHRLYSRLLLSNAKVTLLHMNQDNERFKNISVDEREDGI